MCGEGTDHKFGLPRYIFRQIKSTGSLLVLTLNAIPVILDKSNSATNRARSVRNACVTDMNRGANAGTVPRG